MNPALRFAAVRSYQTSNAAIAIEASPHRQVAMLYDGAIEGLNRSIAAINRHDVKLKLRNIDATLGIVQYLRAVIDFKAGGEIARQLASLYDYIQKRTVEANMHNDISLLQEMATLLRTVKSGWDQIAVAAR